MKANNVSDCFEKGLLRRSLLEKFRTNSAIYPNLDVLDSYRIVRHRIQYSGEPCGETDAQEIVDDAVEFLKIVENFIATLSYYR
jgi:hypothetical protein